ncbi:MAG: beta-lactamase family protein [Rhodospirillaceae bacterium]|nr:beta-lactamase family protein [Rhodospirillaceae bacterium]
MNKAAGLIALILLAGPARAETLSTDKALEARVDAAVMKLMNEKKTVGAEVGVMRDGKMVLAKGYGMANIELGVPVKPDTVFRIGSITKQFTATALLLLAEEKKLSVDDKLSKYFPDFPRADEVTLRMVLNHTSGIHNYTDAKADIDPHKDMTTAEMVRNIQSLSPLYDFEPGTKYSYSNSGYFLLGAIVEKMSGQALAPFLKARIFDKQGLSQTAMDDVAELVPNRAGGYDMVKDSPGKFTNTTYASMTWPAGAGAMRSTVGDLAKWHSALFGGKVLKPESLADMTTPGRTKNGQPIDTRTGRPPPAGVEPPVGYAMGLMTGTFVGQPRIGHSGSINGFNAMINTYPQSKLTIVVLNNTVGQSAEFEAAVAHAVLEK